MSTVRGLAVHALVSLGVAVGAIGAYHLAFGADPPSHAGSAPMDSGDFVGEVSALRGEVARLAARIDATGSSRVGSTGGGPVIRLDALESRIRRLEGLGSTPGSAGPLPGVPPSAPGAGGWTEEQVSAVSGMLAEIDARKKRESNAKRMKAMVRSSGAHPTAEEEAAAVKALLAFQDQVEVLYKDGSAGTTPEARAATMARGRELRDGLERDLRAALSTEAVGKILRSLPSFGAPPPVPPAPPAKPGGAPLGPPAAMESPPPMGTEPGDGTPGGK